MRKEKWKIGNQEKEIVIYDNNELEPDDDIEIIDEEIPPAFQSLIKKRDGGDVHD